MYSHPWLILMIFLASSLVSCRPAVNEETGVRQAAERYFELYAARDDWPSFLDQFREDMIFEDVLLNYRVESRDAFAEFYNWPDERYEQVHPDTPNLVLRELVVEGRTAVGRGRFPEFYWDGKLQDWAGPFSITLHFDENGKIREQTDFVYYPDYVLDIVEPVLDSIQNQ